MLYIKVVNGLPVDHPVLQENLQDVFGAIPDEYQPFLRTVQPALEYFEEWDMEAVQYAKIDGTWTDLWPRKTVSAERYAELSAQLRQYTLLRIEHEKKYAAEQREQASDAMKPHWDAFLEELESFVIPDSEDLINLKLPHTPLSFKYDANGNRLTTDMPGSAPNVIG
jgi:hypothetical protein